METNKAILDGADEIDMVLNYTLLKKDIINNYNYLINEVKTLADICHSNINKNRDKIIFKVIVESGLLSELQTKIATNICLNGDADFIKTSTGKNKCPGAELNKVKIMYELIKESDKYMFIKASGGIRTLEQINMFLPYIDRFGIGFKSVDDINNI
jgi:deoxyribose-phosphate aldolase